MDPLRWYLLTQGPLGSTDADFSHAKFVEVYNADLANGIGNCASRVSNMIEKYFEGKVPDYQGRLTHELTESDGVHRMFDWPKLIEDSVKGATAAFERCDLARALGYGLDLVRQVDIFINSTRPSPSRSSWKKARLHGTAWGRSCTSVPRRCASRACSWPRRCR